MNKVKMGFFSFTEVTDPSEHHAYNEWHQLDHMPEQFQLAGLARGERWVSTPACRNARQVSDPLVDPIHYVTLYLMMEPLEPTLRDFLDLGATLRELGRFHEHRRAHLGGPFYLVKAYAADRVLVSADCLPARPHRGVWIEVCDVAPEVSEAYAQWLDRVHVPDVLATDGVAGTYTFASRGSEAAAFANANPPGRRILVHYLEREPLAVAEDFRVLRDEWRAAGRLPDFDDGVKPLFSGPLETIVPWKWDWFEVAG